MFLTAMDLVLSDLERAELQRLLRQTSLKQSLADRHVSHVSMRGIPEEPEQRSTLTRELSDACRAEIKLAVQSLLPKTELYSTRCA